MIMIMIIDYDYDYDYDILGLWYDYYHYHDIIDDYALLGYKSGWESSQLDKQKSPVAQLSTRIASSTVGAHHCWTFLGHLGLRENLEKMSNYEWWKIRIKSH